MTGLTSFAFLFRITKQYFLEMYFKKLQPRTVITLYFHLRHLLHCQHHSHQQLTKIEEQNTHNNDKQNNKT
jgi:hypothetical protein